MAESRGTLLVSVFFAFGAGVWTVGAALFADDASIHVPRWLLAGLGVMFVITSVILWRSGGVEKRAGDGLVSVVLGAVVVTGFAATMDWLVLFTSRDEWAMSGSLPLEWLPDVVLDALFYALLGGMALLVTVAALAMWRQALRRAAEGLPGPIGRALPWVVGAAVAGALGAGGVTLFAGPDGPREPTVRLSFDGGLDDVGPYHLRAAPRGDGVSLRPGVLGQALFVGGARDWVDYDVPVALDLSGSLSLALWLRRDDWVNPYRNGSGTQTVVAAGPLIFGLDVLHEAGTGVRRLRPSASVGDVRLRARGIDVPPHRWVHVAVVYDQRWQAARLYVDGARVARAGVHASPELDLVRPLRVGTWHEANQAYRGEVDDLRLYRYALTAAEIRADAARAR